MNDLFTKFMHFIFIRLRPMSARQTYYCLTLCCHLANWFEICYD